MRTAYCEFCNRTNFGACFTNANRIQSSRITSNTTGCGRALLVVTGPVGAAGAVVAADPPEPEPAPDGPVPAVLICGLVGADAGAAPPLGVMSGGRRFAAAEFVACIGLAVGSTNGSDAPLPPLPLPLLPAPLLGAAAEPLLVPGSTNGRAVASPFERWLYTSYASDPSDACNISPCLFVGLDLIY